MKHVMITSGAKGIGRVVTERLLQDGWNVSVLQRHPIEWAHDRLHMVETGLTDQRELMSGYDAAFIGLHFQR